MPVNVNDLDGVFLGYAGLLQLKKEEDFCFNRCKSSGLVIQ